MEQIKEMTPQESLKLITETMNNNRKEIIRSSGKFFLLWGILLMFFSLLVYFLWSGTDKAFWNYLWFAMPIVGLPVSRLLRKREGTRRAENQISRINGGVWNVFGIFASSIALFTVLYAQFGDSALTAVVLGATLTAQIVLIFGMAEAISGIVLKNRTIQIAGWITGIGGMAIYFLTGANEEQMLIFTFAGAVLAATGLIVKYQYK